jgi:hypothetical protein
MRLLHSAITSSIYELSKVVEFDLQLGDESWLIRIEILRNTGTQGRFRCHIWQAELFRIQSTFPSGEAGPLHHPSDELIWVSFNGPGRELDDDFAASDDEAALASVISGFAKFLEHTTTEEAKL